MIDHLSHLYGIMIALEELFQMNGFHRMSGEVAAARHCALVDRLVETALSKNSLLLSRIWVQVKRMSQIYLSNTDHSSIRQDVVHLITRP